MASSGLRTTGRFSKLSGRQQGDLMKDLPIGVKK